MSGIAVRPAAARDRRSIVDINAGGVPGVAAIGGEELAWLSRPSVHFLVAEADARVGGYLCALAPDAPYDAEEFRWFQARHADFLYVDQVAVAAASRGRGVGRMLYAELVRIARRSGRPRIVCEVNLEPPNPGSLAFHARLGFREVGTLAVADGRMVSLQERDVGATAPR
jgi:uncharacterized protein